jgi:hypothetical protein
MSKASKVHVTKTPQQHRATRQTRPGKAYNGPNLVAQRGESSKKAVRKSTRRSQATPPTE